MTKDEIQKSANEVATQLYNRKDPYKITNRGRVFSLNYNPESPLLPRKLTIENIGKGNPAGPFKINEKFHTMIGNFGLNVYLSFSSNYSEKRPFSLRLDSGPVLFGINCRVNLDEYGLPVDLVCNKSVEYDSRNPDSSGIRLSFPDFALILPSISNIFHNWRINEPTLYVKPIRQTFREEIRQHS